MRLALLGALALATSVQAQVAVVTGRVTTLRGQGIEGAVVLLSGVEVSATNTAPSGLYSFTVPAEKVNGQLVTVRVRAIRYVPEVSSLHLKPGTHTVNFQLASDPNAPRDFVTTAQVFERATAPFKTARQGQDVPGQADPFARFLFPPELVMQHQGALDLQESQREALQNAIQEAQTQTLRMQWALAGEGEKLTKLLQADTLIEKDVLAQVDRILMTEREIKRAQMTLMIRIRNTLTREQQARLRQARGERDE